MTKNEISVEDYAEEIHKRYCFEGCSYAIGSWIDVAQNILDGVFTEEEFAATHSTKRLRKWDG